MQGLISFMTGDENSTGCISTFSSEKIRLAKLSLEWNIRNDPIDGFVKRFKPLYDKMGIGSHTIKQAKEEQQKQSEYERRKQFMMMAGVLLVICGLAAHKAS